METTQYNKVSYKTHRLEAQARRPTWRPTVPWPIFNVHPLQHPKFRNKCQSWRAGKLEEIMDRKKHHHIQNLAGRNSSKDAAAQVPDRNVWQWSWERDHYPTWSSKSAWRSIFNSHDNVTVLDAASWRLHVRLPFIWLCTPSIHKGFNERHWKTRSMFRSKQRKKKWQLG